MLHSVESPPIRMSVNSVLTKIACSNRTDGVAVMPFAISSKNLFTVYPSSTNTISLVLMTATILLLFLLVRTKMQVVTTRKKSAADVPLLPPRNSSTPDRKNKTVDVENGQLMIRGPSPWPIIGSLHLLAENPSPWEAFVRLRGIYGNIYKITLGSRKCVVVSSIEGIREVLVHKGDSFSGRPDFVRYHALFGGDRDRSLALCDWSAIQKIRRHVVMPYVFPRKSSAEFNQLEESIEAELQSHLESLSVDCLRSAGAAPSGGEAIFDKARFSLVCANMFFRYFCSKSYDYGDKYFQKMVTRFDYIFSDINNGCALDMLPWLLPFYAVHLTKLYFYGQFIRRFLLETLIKDRMPDDTHPLKSDAVEPACDFLDDILQRTRMNTDDKQKHLTNDYALYELEDILGGHSAVACFFTRLLAQIIARPDVQRKVQKEIDAVLAKEGSVRLCHGSTMMYTQAVILETLRVTTSPIVPHVACEDSSILGFPVEKDTLVMINNYYLNTSPRFWKSPEIFDPTRFISAKGHISKPDFFLPFGTGKRSCLGYQLLQTITFLSLVRLLQHYDIFPTEEDAIKLREGATDVFNVERAKLSVDNDSVRAIFRPRVRTTGCIDVTSTENNQILVE